MAEDGPERDKLSQNDAIRRALAAAANVDPIDTALSAVEGDHTIIVEDAAGNPREVTFIAPDFPPTFDGERP